MKKHGFGHFVGIDGSEAMLDLARESGLYQDLKQCMLGEEPLPVQCGNFMVHYFTWVIDHLDLVCCLCTHSLTHCLLLLPICNVSCKF